MHNLLHAGGDAHTTPALLSPCWPPASACAKVCRRCGTSCACCMHNWRHRVEDCRLVARPAQEHRWHRRGGGVAEAWRRRGGGGEYRCGLFLVAARQGWFLVRGSRTRPKSNEYIIHARYIYNWKVCECVAYRTVPASTRGLVRHHSAGWRTAAVAMVYAVGATVSRRSVHQLAAQTPACSQTTPLRDCTLTCSKRDGFTHRCAKAWLLHKKVKRLRISYCT